MDFASPKLLYLLLLIPAFILLFLASQVARKRKLQRFGTKINRETLMPNASRYMPSLKLTASMVVVAALIIAIARPRGGEKEVSDNKQGIEIVVALDVSRSMLASSTDESRGISRLNRAKFILNRLIDKLSNDRVSLIVFAGNAYTQLPMTNDFSIARLYLNEVSTSMVTTQGTDIGGAIRMAMNLFTPDTEARKAIIVITDSEDHEQGAIEMAKQASQAGIQVDVIGIGSTKQTPIPIDSSKGEYLKDSSGAVVMTALNEDTAKEIAKAGDGIYINGSAADAANVLVDHLDEMEKTDFGAVKYKASAEQFPWFAWIAFAFIIVDILILNRKNGWLQKINFFSNK